MHGCLAGFTFSEKASSKEEPHSVPNAAGDKLDVLPPPPDGEVIADEGETKNAEILKNNLAEDENIEVMDSHDDAAQTEGKNLSRLWSWFIDYLTTDIEFSVKLFGSSFSELNKLFISPEREPDMEGILMGKKKGEESPAQKTEEPLEYLAEEQGVEGLSVEKQQRKPPENIGILSIWGKTVEI